MKNKKIPYGLSNYKSLLGDNYIYIDKTPYIEKIENCDARYLFFLRPRRFGKSLFTSVLENYYDVNEKYNFQKLFGETYLGKNPTPERNSYYILKFNFSGLKTDTKENLEKTFIQSIKDTFDNFITRYSLDMSYDKECDDAASMFNNFLTKVYFKIDKSIYVIIDEYDHFANELLSFQPELFPEIISKTGFVRKWYEVLKKGTETIVDRIFATGVSPITLDSLTSGFNIASDITRDEDFNEMMGFNEQEVRQIISETIGVAITEKEIDELIEILKKNYNGYLFSEEAETRLFNSDMILYYLKTYSKKKKAPRELIDKNIASDYGKLGRMFDLKNKSQNAKVLESILNGEKIRCRITEGFSLEKDFSQDDFKSLLFYLGMLTIDSYILDRVVLKVPNYAIKGLYFNYFTKKLNEFVDYELNILEIEDAVTNIAMNGNNNNLVSVVEKTLTTVQKESLPSSISGGTCPSKINFSGSQNLLLKSLMCSTAGDDLNKLSNRDFIKFDEKYVKLIFLTYCFLSKIYLVKSEYEVNDGYIDIALLKQANMEPSYYGIFELKYITKAQYNAEGEEVVRVKTEEAIAQLMKYSDSEELKAIPNLKKWAVVFVGDKCVVNKEIYSEDK